MRVSIYLYKPTGAYYNVDPASAEAINSFHDPEYGEEKPYQHIATTDMLVVSVNVKLKDVLGVILIDGDGDYWFQHKFTKILEGIGSRRAQSLMN